MIEYGNNEIMNENSNFVRMKCAEIESRKTLMKHRMQEIPYLKREEKNYGISKWKLLIERRMTPAFNEKPHKQANFNKFQ